jgi:hypothetical protein
MKISRLLFLAIFGITLLAYADSPSNQADMDSNHVEKLEQAVQANRKGVAMLENLALKAKGTAKERDLVFRVLENLLQSDRLLRQLALQGKDAGSMDSPELKKVQIKIEYYSTRFLDQSAKDPRFFKVMMVRAKSREGQGKATAVQDYETIFSKAEQKSEERIKAGVKLGEIHRSNGNALRSEQTLFAVLSQAPDQWKVFITESLQQTYLVSKQYGKALKGVNWLLAKRAQLGQTQIDAYVVQKGQILGKLLLESKSFYPQYFKEISYYSATEQAQMIESSFLEVAVKNQEVLLLNIIHQAAFRELTVPVKLSVCSQLAVILYDQKSMDSLENLIKEMTFYSATPDGSVLVENAMKRLLELSTKIQSTIAKDSKLAKSQYGKILDDAYALIIKVTPAGKPNVVEAKYNRANLVLAQERPEVAFPLFRELGNFKDAESRFSLSFILALKKNDYLKDAWEFKSAPNPALGPYVPALTEQAKKYCPSQTFESNFCFDSIRGLVQGGQIKGAEYFLKQVLFDRARTPADQSQAFSALFDYYQSTASTEGDRATALVNEVAENGIKIDNGTLTEAKKTVKADSLMYLQKTFKLSKDEEVLQFVDSFEKSNPKQIFPELYAYAGLSAQRLGDESATVFYNKFEQMLASGADGKAFTIDPAFMDMVTVGRAVAAEKVFNYPSALTQWLRVKSWNSTQKRLALNASWLAGDLTTFGKLISLPGFCTGAEQSLCENYKVNFALTWPTYMKSLSINPAVAFAVANTKVAKKQEDAAVKVVQALWSLQSGAVIGAARLKYTVDAHQKWQSLDPVKQIAFFPSLQNEVKKEIQSWMDLEVSRFSKVANLTDFQNALKAFKKNENLIGPFSQSTWTDFQVGTELASALVYSICLKALDQAKGHDQEILSQDESVKALFDQVADQLKTKQAELIAGAFSKIEGQSYDLSLFDSTIQKYALVLPNELKTEWEQTASMPLKVLPKSFYESLEGQGKQYKEIWLRALVDKNWAAMGSVLVTMLNDQSLPQGIYSAFEAETFLRFGNRLDAQKVISQQPDAASVPVAQIQKYQFNFTSLPTSGRMPASASGNKNVISSENRGNR